jgi:hypothetical protein
MEEDFRELLQYAALRGHALTPTTEINWGVHPQGVDLPGVVLNLVAGAEGHTQQGRDGLTRAVVQVDVYALTYEAALYLAREVRCALDAYRGAVTCGVFEGIFLTATRSGRESGTNEAERAFRRSMDFDVNWRAT